MRGCFTWIIRIIGLLLLLLVISLAIGFFWEQSAEASAAENFPAKGQVYTVNDRQMHLYCIGEGSPTVILDAGLGGWSVDFEALQSLIAAETRVCSYDRAGYGWSDAAASPRDAQAMASDLGALLDAASITEPIVLVGFSYSGLSSRLFALQNPARVAGLILLDPAHEADMDLYTAELAQQQQSLVGVYGFFGGLARFGIIRFLNPEEMAPYAPFIAQGKGEAYYTAVSAPQWWQTSQQEFETMINGSSAAQVLAAGALPNDLPLVVIAAGVAPTGAPESFMVQRQSSLQALAAQSEQGQFILAEGTGHNDIINRSDLILEALRPMLASD